MTMRTNALGPDYLQLERSGQGNKSWFRTQTISPEIGNPPSAVDATAAIAQAHVAQPYRQVRHLGITCPTTRWLWP